MSTDPNDLIALRELLVKPAIEMLRVELKTHTDTIEKIVEGMNTRVGGVEQRTSSLESGQRKAMIGFGVYATALATGVGVFTNWIRSKL